MAHNSGGQECHHRKKRILQRCNEGSVFFFATNMQQRPNYFGTLEGQGDVIYTADGEDIHNEQSSGGRPSGRGRWGEDEEEEDGETWNATSPQSNTNGSYFNVDGRSAATEFALEEGKKGGCEVGYEAEYVLEGEQSYEVEGEEGEENKAEVKKQPERAWKGTKSEQQKQEDAFFKALQIRGNEPTRD